MVPSTIRVRDEEPTAILLRKTALKASVGNDPTIGCGPAWVATWAGPFLTERPHHSDSR